jgi:uncharacterized protein
MTTPPSPSSDVAFTDRVKAEQTRRGSRAAYARLERDGGFQTEIGDDLAAFVASQRSVFLATASAAGQPYVQHRGGPPGFLEVLDPRTIAFADFGGNRSTSAWATWPRTRRSTSSSSTTRTGSGSRSGARPG